MTTDEHAADLAWQHAILQEVSRTFALTIPQLPSGLRDVVGNAYLLCRIADTIEDEPTLAASGKCEFSERFIRVVAGEEPPAPFAEQLAPRLSDSMLLAERQLVANTPRVLRITQEFSDRQRAALVRCVRIMSHGMAEFQQSPGLKGLDDLPHLDRYCYHVAGVVGEMLTELFCDYSAEIDRHRKKLLQLAVSFGQGLQMTNILKDLWDDRARGACWLPRDVFQQSGFDLHSLEADRTNPAFRTVLNKLIGLARMHLGNALAFTLLIPRREAGIRRFCLWALGMAVLTLRRIHAHADFTSGQQVKISRRSVWATVVVTSLAVRSDVVLKALFARFTRSLPSHVEAPV